RHAPFYVPITDVRAKEEPILELVDEAQAERLVAAEGVVPAARGDVRYEIGVGPQQAGQAAFLGDRTLWVARFVHGRQPRRDLRPEARAVADHDGLGSLLQQALQAWRAGLVDQPVEALAGTGPVDQH